MNRPDVARTRPAFVTLRRGKYACHCVGLLAYQQASYQVDNVSDAESAQPADGETETED